MCANHRFTEPTLQLAVFQNIPRNTGLGFNVVMAAPRSPEREIFKAVFPLPTSTKGTVKITEKRGVATGFFQYERAIASRGFSKVLCSRNTS
jgi:hypothetical protein